MLAKMAIVVAVGSLALPLFMPVFLGVALLFVLAATASAFAGTAFYGLRMFTSAHVKWHNRGTVGR